MVIEVLPVWGLGGIVPVRSWVRVGEVKRYDHLGLIVPTRQRPNPGSRQAVQKLIGGLARAEKAQVLPWMAHDLGDAYVAEACGGVLKVVSCERCGLEIGYSPVLHVTKTEVESPPRPWEFTAKPPGGVHDLLRWTDLLRHGFWAGAKVGYLQAMRDGVRV